MTARASFRLVVVLLSCVACAAVRAPASQPAPTTRQPMVWGDADRDRKLATALDEMAALVDSYARGARVPGLAVGVVADGRMVWFRGWGVREVATSAPIDQDTVFRIASMSKAFISAAVVKLRDEGKLSLDEPVETYLPELKRITYPTADSPRITLRYLLSHASGLPEDNAVADLRLPMPEADLDRCLAEGLSFSTVPGTEFEYSNLGFVLAARAVARVTGVPFQQYVSRHLLKPLGMEHTVWDARIVPEAHRARGYGRKGSAMPSEGLEKYVDDELHEERVLEDGSWAPPGGLWTSPRDYARWIAFQLGAWPPRDAADDGPVRRASIRETHSLHRFGLFSAQRDDAGALDVRTGGYGFGWNVIESCRFTRVTHSGGLPGYGSYVMLLPEEDLGVFVMTNLTYTGGFQLALDIAARLQDRGLLPRRLRPVSPHIERARAEVLGLMDTWSAERAAVLFDVNHADYETPEALRSRLARLRAIHGACRPTPDGDAQNALRGRIRLDCDRGALQMSVELTSDVPPRIQTLELDSMLNPSEQLMRAAANAIKLLNRWEDDSASALLSPTLDRGRTRKGLARITTNQGPCALGAPTRSDGTTVAAFRLPCDRGAATLALTLDPATGRVADLSVSTVEGTLRCPR